MIPALAKRLPSILICLCLVAGRASAQSQEQAQERLVDTVNRAEQMTSRAGEKFQAGDTAGGCVDLRAATTDSQTSLDLVRQLAGQIGQDTTLHDDTRDQMLQDLQNMSARLTSQKQTLDARISARCN